MKTIIVFTEDKPKLKKKFDDERAKIVKMSVGYTQKRVKQALELLTDLARIVELQKDLKKANSSQKENYVKSKAMEQIIKDSQLGLPLHSIF